MISEKKLERRAKYYSTGVIHALTKGGMRTMQWWDIQKLVEATYFNGFQSGVVWQKEAEEHVGRKAQRR